MEHRPEPLQELDRALDKAEAWLYEAGQPTKQRSARAFAHIEGMGLKDLQCRLAWRLQTKIQDGAYFQYVLPDGTRINTSHDLSLACC
jgi:hypothetical protein